MELPPAGPDVVPVAIMPDYWTLMCEVQQWRALYATHGDRMDRQRVLATVWSAMSSAYAMTAQALAAEAPQPPPPAAPPPPSVPRPAPAAPSPSASSGAPADVHSRAGSAADEARCATLAEFAAAIDKHRRKGGRPTLADICREDERFAPFAKTFEALDRAAKQATKSALQKRDERIAELEAALREANDAMAIEKAIADRLRHDRAEEDARTERATASTHAKAEHAIADLERLRPVHAEYLQHAEWIQNAVHGKDGLAEVCMSALVAARDALSRAPDMQAHRIVVDQAIERIGRVRKEVSRRTPGTSHVARALVAMLPVMSMLYGSASDDGATTTRALLEHAATLVSALDMTNVAQRDAATATLRAIEDFFHVHTLYVAAITDLP